MQHAEILNVVKKYLAHAVDNVAVEQIDPQKSMIEYGATSLDIVEVVSSSMRELKIKIPRTELSNITNISGLVDIFYKYATSKQEAVAHA